MKLTILGSSSALPTSERFPSAHVLNVHERLFLIDCGEGTQMQLRRNRIKFSRINNIFLSHLHGDHVFGLYGLLSTLSLMGRKTPLALYAPESYQHILFSHLADFDIHLNYEINFVSLSGKDPVKIFEDKYVTVTAFPLQHRIQSFGFLFNGRKSERNIIKEAITKYKIPTVRIPAIKLGADFLTMDGELINNRDITTDPPEPLSYAYCSDTRYFSRLPAFFKGVTVLFHEATFNEDLKELAALTGHSTTKDAARTALEAGAGTLIIGHFSARYRNITPLVEEARSVFPATIPAIDGKTYDIESSGPPLEKNNYL